METTIDEVSIEIDANAKNANSNLDKLAASIENLQNKLNIGLKGLNSFKSNISKIKEITSGLNFDGTGFEKIQTSLNGFTGISKSTNLSSFVKQLKEIPNITNSLDNKTISEFTSKIKELTNALKPLATEMVKVSTAFSALPNNVKKINSTLDQTKKTINKTNKKGNFIDNLFSGTSGGVLKTGLLIAAIQKLGTTIGGFVNESNSYIENMNLFTVSMGEMADKAKEFTNNFSKALGIDSSNIMRYMGLFNSLIEGFGISSDVAYTMSKNLTQLSYDLSSFLNISIEDAMQKLKSGISGEIEPMRAIGVALDEASLQETAYALGIDRRVSSMTRAQKTELLYYQIMSRTTKMQGDMARTLLQPANAIRVLQQRFTLLARSIGNIFLPIIMTVIPYIMVLTEALTKLANMIANFLGFELPEISFGTDVGLGDISAGLDDVGSSASGANKELQKMLGNFDELNVIDFNDSLGSGSGGSAGTGGTGGSLGIPLPDYDALTGLAEQKLEKIKKQLDDFIKKVKDIWNKVSPILKKLEPLIVGVGSALLTAFSIKWIAKFLSKFKTIKTTTTIVTQIVSAVKVAITVFSKFGGGMTGLTASATSLWRAFERGIKSLSTFQKTILGISSIVGIFTTVYTAIKNLTLGTTDFGSALVNIGIAVTAFGAILSALTTGPIGIAITAITAITAGVLAYEKAQKEIAEQKALEKMFDGQGQSMEAVISYYEELNEKTSKYTDTILNAGENIDSNNEKFDETAVSIENLSSKMSSLFYNATDSDFDNMNSNFEELGNIAQENLAKMVSGIIANINQIKKLGQIDDENAQKMIDNAIKVQQAQGNKIADLEYKMIRLNTAYRNGNVSQEEYRNEVSQLLQEMAKLNNGISEAETKFNSFVKSTNSQTVKINLESPEKAKKYIEELSTIYEEQMENIKNSNSQIENYYDNLIVQAEGDTALIKALEEDKTKMMEENNKYLKQIQGDYKGTWLTIRSELAASGADTADDMKDIVNTINENLGGLKDVDLSGTGGEVFNKYLEELEKGNKMVMPKVATMLQNMGISFKNTYLEGVQFNDAEKMIISKNWSDASQIKGSDFNALIQKIAQDGVTIKNSMRQAIEFTDAEKKTLSKMLSDPYSVNPSDKAKILNKIIEFGGEIRDSEGNSVQFTDEEKEAIKKAMDSPILSWTESDRLITATDKYTKNVLDTMIQNIYNRSDDSENAGKDVGNAAGDGIITSIQGKTPEAAKSAQTLVTNVNNSMKNAVNTTSAGEQAINQFDNAMNRGKWNITNTASSIGTSAGNSFSDSLKVNNSTFKKSLNDTFSNTISRLKSKNSGLFATLGINIPFFNWFAEGGFPETGQLFLAREAGPELVGNIGNKAAVANNDQIVEGIAQAAYQGVSQAMRENKGNERQPVNVYIGNKKVYSGYGQYISSENNMYGASTVRV